MSLLAAYKVYFTVFLPRNLMFWRYWSAWLLRIPFNVKLSKDGKTTFPLEGSHLFTAAFSSTTYVFLAAQLVLALVSRDFSTALGTFVVMAVCLAIDFYWFMKLCEAAALNEIEARLVADAYRIADEAIAMSYKQSTPTFAELKEESSYRATTDDSETTATRK